MAEQQQPKLCLWKKIALADEQRMLSGNEIVTLERGKKCHSCRGYDVDCLEFYESRYVPEKPFPMETGQRGEHNEN